MTTDKFTPGPRKVEAEDGPHLYHKHRYITAGEDDTDAWEIVARVSDAQNQEANSRLIAAAPDLLDALTAILPYVPDWTAPTEVYDRAVTAIAKAKVAP